MGTFSTLEQHGNTTDLIRVETLLIPSFTPAPYRSTQTRIVQSGMTHIPTGYRHIGRKVLLFYYHLHKTEKCWLLVVDISMIRIRNLTRRILIHPVRQTGETQKSRIQQIQHRGGNTQASAEKCICQE